MRLPKIGITHARHSPLINQLDTRSICSLNVEMRDLKGQIASKQVVEKLQFVLFLRNNVSSKDAITKKFLVIHQK